jgi:hypothetical protein
MPQGMLHRADACGCEKRIGMSKSHIPQQCDHGNLLVYVHGLTRSDSHSPAQTSAPRRGGMKQDAVSAWRRLSARRSATCPASTQA